jgi:nucleotide-binding universal stress UspA family protein
MVALDFSRTDEALLRFTGMLAEAFHSEIFYFLHVVPDLTNPVLEGIEFQQVLNLREPVDERLRNKLAEEVRDLFSERPGQHLHIEILEGKPYERLIHWAEVKNIDLVVVGNKTALQGGGTTAKRVVRHVAGNVLSVPESAGEAIRNILVPLDFSHNSFRALQAALDLGKTLPNTAVKTFYVVSQPSDLYYPPEISDQRFSGMLMQAAKDAHKKFLKKYGLENEPMEAVFTQTTFSNISSLIVEHAENNDFDLVVMGAQGHTGVSRFFIGSVTEAVIERSKNVPVLVVR